MYEQYGIDYDLPGMDDNKGMNYFDQARISSYMKELQSCRGTKGFDFVVHAIGDRGIR